MRRTDEIAIEQNIPLPPRGTGTMRAPETVGVMAALKAMKVGDSILLPPQYQAAAQIGGFRKRFTDKRKFTTRLTAEGLRVWRIK